MIVDRKFKFVATNPHNQQIVLNDASWGDVEEILEYCPTGHTMDDIVQVLDDVGVFDWNGVGTQSIHIEHIRH